MEKKITIKFSLFKKLLGEELYNEMLYEIENECGEPDTENEVKDALIDYVAERLKVDSEDITELWFSYENEGDDVEINFECLGHFKYGVVNLITAEVFSTNNKKSFLKEIERVVLENNRECEFDVAFNETIESVGATYKALVSIRGKQL